MGERWEGPFEVLGRDGEQGGLTRDRDFSGCSGRGFGSPNN